MDLPNEFPSFFFTVQTATPSFSRHTNCLLRRVQAMEVIRAVSGAVALVESTGKVAKSITNLARRWTNAPEGKDHSTTQSYVSWEGDPSFS